MSKTIAQLMVMSGCAMAIGGWAGDWKAGAAAFGLLCCLDVWVMRLQARDRRR